MHGNPIQKDRLNYFHFFKKVKFTQVTIVGRRVHLIPVRIAIEILQHMQVLTNQISCSSIVWL